jgi:dipeptidyl aminopeptidase/acylaminoacyl peptidase
VHEYGGGAFTVRDGVLYFSQFDDQRLYQQLPGQPPQPLTPAGAWRYADGIVDSWHHRLLCVREDHTQPDREPVNTLVSIDATGDVMVLAAGHDFFSSPTLSPDGTRLAWLTWDHPNMPWDGTELWLATLEPDGSLADVQKVAGGRDESIFQPHWGPDGQLYFVSDRTGWWNLYRWQRDRPQGGSVPDQQGHLVALCPMAAEFGSPQWVFGKSTYGFASPEQLVCTYTHQGTSHLASLDLRTLELMEIPTPYSSIHGLKVAAGVAVFIGGSATTPSELVRLDLQTQAITILRRSMELSIPPGYLSAPQAIEFPTDNGLTAYGLYYPPKNQDVQAPASQRPPLLVKSHGGPTASTSSELNLRIQYWTSRGFAVLDVDYGGSTGYGREYRQRLNGNWGIVDVADCINGAKYLVARDLVDGNRLVIAGGSAGGYTTLCALTFYDLFKAGASYYGVSDLEVLATDTHKFESRYMDTMIGPYPECQSLYYQRSPIHFVERLSCPLIFFQGDEDKVVPPNQAEMMVNALRQKGVPVAYVLYQGEQHGFRKAENIKRTLDGEFYFYSQVFGFQPADAIEPVAIENLASL